MESILFLTLLFDFYSELLTEKQRFVFEMHYLNDYSLQEVADELNVTRQAVGDLLGRTEKLLLSYERALNLVEKHLQAFEIAEKIRLKLEPGSEICDEFEKLIKFI